MNGLSAAKLESEGFINCLVKNDIIFLYEFWTGSKSNIDLSGYLSHNFYRPFSNRYAKRPSGGVALYYRESLKDGIEIIRNHHNTIVWLKLDCSFFHNDKDIYLCGIYLWCEGSPAYEVLNVDFFELLENDIDCFSALGPVFICGDFNSRTGLKHDFIVCDKNMDFLNDDVYVPDMYFDRVSMDTKCNNFGNRLLDLCKSTNMRIVNGRLRKDQGVGSFTYVSQNGASVVDYLLSMECVLSNITCFSVLSLNEWSDRAPIQFSLACKNVPLQGREINEIKYKWSDACKQTFRSCLIDGLPNLNRLFDGFDPNSGESINSTVSVFSKILQRVADPLFSHVTCRTDSPAFTNTPVLNDAEWFDGECRRAKSAYDEALRVFSSCKSETSRKYLLDCKHKYKLIVRRKKRAFKLRRLKDMESLKFCKPKDFWKHFRKKVTHDEPVSLDEFFNYFSTLENGIFQTINREAEDFCAKYNFDSPDFDNELDYPITQEEILKAVRKLKRNKAYGKDCLLNEYFIEGINILLPFVCDLFNAILNSSCFPDRWREGLLIPLTLLE